MKNSKTPLVSVVINNYNGKKYIVSCLESVFKTKYPKFEVVIVDDVSEDDSIKVVKEKFGRKKNLRIHKMSKNSGTAATRNKGAQISKGDIVIFLDNDTEVTSNWITELVRSLAKSKEIGASQSLLLDFSNRKTIQMAGGRLIPQVGWLAPYDNKENYRKVKGKLKERNIIGITAALAVKGEVFRKIGYFDEKLVAYVSDIEFSWRAWIAGYKVVLSPKSVVYHWTKSMKQRKHMHETSVNAYFHLSKNSFRTIMKNYEIKNTLRYLPYSLFINFGRSIIVLFQRRDSSAIKGTFKGFFWNIFNIGNTIVERRNVQKTRVVKDSYIMERVMVSEGLWEVYKRYFMKPNG
jgi:GT2 family glycosyltransferase